MEKVVLREVEESLPRRKEKKVYEFLKRGMDITASLIGLLLLSPIFLIISILIKVESDGPVFFKQERVGKNGNHFFMYKFRSMVINAEELRKKMDHMNEMSGPMFKMKDDPRITQIGKFIRKTSIDELPQLVNILKGEMRLVGPRPSLPSEVAKFEAWMMKRLEVLPGLTCFWQVSGRNSIGFQEWMEMDVKYVEERNLLLDIKLSFLKVYPSQANYVLCELKNGLKSKELAIELLEKDNVLIKDLGDKATFEGKEYIRLAVRDEKDNNYLLDVLKGDVNK